MKRTFAALLFAAASLSTAMATPCATGTIASYVAAAGSGCDLGALIYKDFSFSVVSSSGGAVAALDTEVFVSPTLVGADAGIGITSNKFSVPTGGSITYKIGYLIDPPPIIGGQSLEMSALDGLGGSNGVFIDQFFCPGDTIVDQFTCSADVQPKHQQVFFDNSTSQLTTSQTFANTNMVGVLLFITIDGTDGATGFAGVSSGTGVDAPEPLSMALTGSGLLGLLLAARRFRPSSQQKL
jgi:hypothetical protein